MRTRARCAAILLYVSGVLRTRRRLVSLCGPMVIADPGTQTVATGRPAPERPRLLALLNAPIQWGGAVDRQHLTGRRPSDSCMRERVSTTAVLCFTLVLSCPAPALTQSRFDSWTTENGLPQNSIRDILQTRDGYLWLATEGGLVRFDGARFVVFDRSVPGFESQRIGALREDRHGTLWAATTDGRLIRYQGGYFTTYGRKDGLPNAASLSAGATRIEEDDEGGLWVTWIDDAVTRLVGTQITNFGPGDFAMPAGRDRRLYLDNWWRQDSAAVHVFAGGRVQTVRLPPGGANTRVTGVNIDNRGSLWIRTDGAGVLSVSAGRIARLTVQDGLPGNTLDGLFQGDGRGSIWFFDRGKRTTYRIRNGSHEHTGLAGGGSFYVDREGSTWIGTSQHGLQRLRDDIFTLYTEREGLSFDRTYPILHDRSGAIWIGTGGGGLNKYADGRFTSYGPADGLPSDSITCLYEDSAGRLWVGTLEGLAYRQGNRFIRYTAGAGLPDGTAWVLREDRHGTFWIGTRSGLFKRDGDRFTRYTTAEGLTHDSITALFEDRRGALWIGTYQGITRLQDGVLTRFAEAEGFVGHEARAFHEDADGHLWIGTYDGGLYRLVQDRLTRYTRNDGLHDNGVFQILEDDQGYFWMGSNRGLSRVSRTELNELAEGRRRAIVPVVFGTRDGLRSLEFNGGPQPSGLKTADGRLWFPTMAGVAVVDPSAIRALPAPRPIIEEIRVAGEVVNPGQQLTVPADAGMFEIVYTAPTFVKPEQVRFRYRLDGLSDAWVDAGARRSVSFYRVPPGRYAFVLSASNHTGEWSVEGPALRIVILPPFWGTWWFRLLAVGVLASSVIAAHVGRVRRLRREQAQRSVYLQELIDAQEQERARISNEMHDSLGYDVSMVKQRVRESLARPVLDVAIRRDFEEVLRLADRIEGEMKTIAYALRPYHLDKVGLTRSIQELVFEMAAASGVELKAELAPIDDLFTPEAEIHIYRMIQESLNNVVKHSGAYHAAIVISRVGQDVEIRVEDDGEGLSRRREGAADGEGLGLIGIRERARMIGGDVRIESRLRRGTSMIVRLTVPRSDHE
jgi:ligand-binding sensor domain-containing protein/signal transduction histidine kinase